MKHWFAMRSDNRPRPAGVAGFGLIAAVCLGGLVSLGGCQVQKNDFNPVRVLCPGDFDPVTNKCRIETHGPDDGSN